MVRRIKCIGITWRLVKTQTVGPNSQSFWFSRTVWDQEFVFLMVLRWFWACWSRDHALLRALVYMRGSSGNPHSFVCARERCQSQQACTKRKFPKEMRISSFPAKSGGYIWLLVLGAVHTEAASRRKQRNHNSGLEGGNLGFGCSCAPSVPLFTS